MRNELGQFAAGAPSEKRKEWVGKQFGKLTVIGVAYGVMRGKKRRTICTCKCECGNTVDVVSDSLSSGKKISCGCDTKERRIKSNRIDLTGKRFGKLTVQEMLWDNHPTKCRCICDCGNEAVVINTQLTSGKTSSCGCIQRERSSNANTKDLSGIVTDSGIIIKSKIRQDERGVWIYDCICPICNRTFQAIPAKLKSTNQISCGCSLLSKGELAIASILDSYNVRYERQYSINGCSYKNKLKFDFAIIDDDGFPTNLIEYDGMQHYVPIDHFGGVDGFADRKRRDEIKNKFCKEHNISLTRLPYTMSIDEIKDTIKSIINP